MTHVVPAQKQFLMLVPSLSWQMIGDFRHEKRRKKARWDSNLYRGAVRTRGLAIEEDIRPNTATHHLAACTQYIRVRTFKYSTVFGSNRAASFDTGMLSGRSRYERVTALIGLAVVEKVQAPGVLKRKATRAGDHPHPLRDNVVFQKKGGCPMFVPSLSW